jgi:hypothetical protein
VLVGGGGGRVAALRATAPRTAAVARRMVDGWTREQSSHCDVIVGAVKERTCHVKRLRWQLTDLTGACHVHCVCVRLSVALAWRDMRCRRVDGGGGSGHCCHGAQCRRTAGHGRVGAGARPGAGR